MRLARVKKRRYQVTLPDGRTVVKALPFGNASLIVGARHDVGGWHVIDPRLVRRGDTLLKARAT